MKTLLSAIDFSGTTDVVVENASRLAEELGARLWLLHVTSDEMQAVNFDTTGYSDLSPDYVNMPGDVQLARDLNARELKREHAALLAISSKLRERGLDTHAALLRGEAARVIVEKAESLQAEMIILGSHGHGILHKALLGSVSESVIRQAPCNVLIVPTPGQ